LLKNDVFGAGMYRLRCVLRRTGRRHFALQVHHAWKDGVCFGVDCESGEVAYLHEKSTNFDIVQRPRVIFGPDNWIGVSAFIRIGPSLIGELFVILYAAKTNRDIYYDGMGEDCFAVAALDIDRVHDFEG